MGLDPPDVPKKTVIFFTYTTLKIEIPYDFPKPPNRLEMIGDLKATLLLNRLLDPKSDLFKLVVISKVEEVMTQLLIETRSGNPLILISSL